MSIANYSFLPWLRRGISNSITTPVGQPRAEVEVAVTVNNSEEVTTKVQLIGPGDITGINSTVILRTDPRNWITDFEPNYFPFIEFYDEDFPWRYTPTTPDSDHRLCPWLHLLLLKEDEFERTTGTNRPLTSIKLLANVADVFPDSSQTWAWAHVHVNSKVSATSSTPDEAALDALIESNPDIAVSRLFATRKLEEKTGYYAFLIPSFETGRLAGLGETVEDNMDALTASWKTSDASGKEYPIYYEWFFRTGSSGDFEYLVSLLKPRTMDSKIGIRDMDVHQPQFGLSDLSENAIVGLEGALKAPATVSKGFQNADDKAQFEEQVKEIINLPEDLKEEGNETTPIVSPPFYGKWHALVSRLNTDEANENWINNLNKDPRHRTGAGIGTLIVQKNQESYMKTAWQQVGDILAANQKIRFTQLALSASEMIYSKYVVSLDNYSQLLITAPVHKKILGSPTTIYQQVKESIIPTATFSRSFRRLTRPKGNLSQNLNLTQKRNENLLEQINNGSVTVAATKDSPSEIINTDVVSNELSSVSNVKHKKTILFFILAIILLFFLLFSFTHNFLIALIVVAVTIVAGIYFLNRKKEKDNQVVLSISSGNITTYYVNEVEPVSSFAITPPGSPSSSMTTIGTVTEESDRFKSALLGFAGLLEFPVIQPAIKPAFNLTNAKTKVNSAINPVNSFNKRVLPGIKIGDKLLESIDPVMAYPDIKQPMYEPLRDTSSELLIPNLNLIPQNTISLLETNQPFIEAYMTGLNHEFARELLWREYPTDKRGSYFRQFWDVSRYINTEELSEEELAEKLKDITPLHTWSKSSNLGDHNNRENDDDSSQLVLVIRGDVLKKYPNTVIYAQKAMWADDEIKLVINDTGSGDLDDTNVLYPSYSASVNPDITFIGFDLTIEEAKGDVQSETKSEKDRLGNTNLGWFFILKEVPGEPRFGLDAADSEATSYATSWNDLSWGHLDTATKCVDVTTQIKANVTGTVQWGTNAADMAYILYQMPVMIAVHAKDMLEST